MAKQVTAWDVFNEMTRTNDKALKLAPMDNIISVNYNHKRGTEVTFGCEGNLAFQIQNAELCGGFIYCDAKRFAEIKKQLVEASQ